MKELTQFQQYIFTKMKDLIPLSGEPIINRKDIRILLGIKQNIPLSLHKSFLEDLEVAGLIKFHNRRKVEIRKDIEFPDIKHSKDEDRDVEIL